MNKKTKSLPITNTNPAEERKEINLDVLNVLSSVERGDKEVQDQLCHYVSNPATNLSVFSDEFWNRVEAIAAQGEDYANFIMHCRYRNDPAQHRLAYDYIRKAIRHDEVPLAYLYLGITYAQGIGIHPNKAIANYYFVKARAKGCEQARDFISDTLELGNKFIIKEIKTSLAHKEELSPKATKRIREQVERERVKKNYGYLSQLHDDIFFLFPYYSFKQGMTDILEGRDTANADIYFAISTENNYAEIDVDLQDRLLSQLFAPVTQDTQLLQRIKDKKFEPFFVVGNHTNDIAQCFRNLSSNYKFYCHLNATEPVEMTPVEDLQTFPYIPASTITQMRRETLRALLSLQKVSLITILKFLPILHNDQRLLEICEEVPNQKLQMFLIQFVELNVEARALYEHYQELLQAYRSQKLEPLADHLNEFALQLEMHGIEHHLPHYRSDRLPSIDLYSAEADDTPTTASSKEEPEHEKPEVMKSDEEKSDFDKEIEKLMNNLFADEDFSSDNQSDENDDKSIKKDEPSEGDEQENTSNYSFMMSPDGQLLLLIDARMGEPSNSMLLFDGAIALLCRDVANNIIFRDLTQDACKALDEAQEILVIERQNDQPQHEYVVPVRRVRDVNELIA